MHMVTYTLVEAPTQYDALVKKATFDRLVGANPHSCAVFDYYVTFDKDETTEPGRLAGVTCRRQPPSTQRRAASFSAELGRPPRKSFSEISTT